MKKNKHLTSIILFSAVLFHPISYAADQDIVFLRSDCSSVNSNQLCFTSVAETETWLWTTRQPTPSEASPVTVKMGPGSFLGTLHCIDNGYVSFLGSGPNNTTLLGETGNAFVGENCEAISFQDMTIKNSGGNYPLLWGRGGSSRWINVEVDGKDNVAWHDNTVGGCAEKAVHYWFNSRLISNGVANGVYDTTCGESWFYGSELTKSFNNPVIAMGSIIEAYRDADVRLFGSVIRAVIEDGMQPFYPGEVTGVKLSDNANFHMHGGIISINQSAGINTSVKGIISTSSGIAHTPDTAFALIPGTNGTITRISNTGTGSVMSPFQWPARSTPPVINSQIGSDTFVETDCDNSGDCSGNGAESHPHIMVYDESCNTNGTWFDTATNACRQ